MFIKITYIDIIQLCSQTMIKTYADENLLRINVFIRDPFVTKFVRDEAQSVINFVSTCGGKLIECVRGI